jgi:hypothetical protein
MVRSALVLLACGAVAVVACGTDADCSLNGRCSGGACSCYHGWTGAACESLNVAPVPPIQGYGMTPNLSASGIARSH